MLRSKRREHETPFDPELAELPEGARWREWLGRVEAAIFAAREPVARDTLARLVGPRCNLDDLLSDIRDELRARPYELVHVAGGWQLRTKARYADAIRALNNGARDAGPPELTPTELLAVTTIAYLQPATRAELSRLVGKEVSRDVIGRLKSLDLIGVFVTLRGADCQGCAFRAGEGMRKKIKLTFGPGIEVEEIELRDGRWVLSAHAAGERSCPVCGELSTSRHDWHHRRLQDLPVQGTPLLLDLRLGRWRCLNEQCSRKTFVERVPSVAAPLARRTVRVAEIVRLFAHAAGGLPSERLLARLAMPVSDNAILRQLKRHVRERADPLPLRAIAIDDWSWRKGSTYGTIVVDLERRTVADVLATRSAKETADWLERRPEIEIVSRDRSGLYARGIRQGAPQARQVADRFHLLQNLRESIERQMTAISCFGDRSRLPPAPGDRQSVLRGRSRDARELMFEQAKDLHASGKSFVAIAAEIGVGHRTIAKWIEANALPHRRRLTLKPSSPLYFQDFLARRWAEGDKVGRRLFHDIRHRGYTGSRSHLERLLSEWRRVERPATSRPRESTREDRAIDPATGWQISPVVGAALCMKPTRMLTPSQAAKVAVLKEASPSFVVMRRLAMRFRGVLRGSDPGKLGSWLDDARHSGIQLLQQFARILSRDIDAVRNAIAEPWSSGQAEGQINRLKTLKRAMFGRAGIELLRARMLPIQ